MTDWADEAAKRCMFEVAVSCADEVSIAAALRKARADALEEAIDAIGGLLEQERHNAFRGKYISAMNLIRALITPSQEAK